MNKDNIKLINAKTKAIVNTNDDAVVDACGNSLAVFFN